MSMLEESRVFKPFHYPWAMEMAEDHEKIHWGSWELKLQEDVDQWKSNTISDVEKNHVTQILRLFTQSDVQVAQNYCDLFIPKLRIMKFVICYCLLLIGKAHTNVLTQC